MIGRIYIVTWPNGYFGSASQSWQTLDVVRISKMLEGRFDAKIHICAIDKILGEDLNADDILIYSSSENSAMRDYIMDHIYVASLKSRVVPEFQHLMAHENKGFQQIYRDSKKFGELGGRYFVSASQFDEVSFPYVFKTIDGAGSSGVKLIESRNNFFIVRHFYGDRSLYRKMIMFVRRLMLSEFQFSIYRYGKQKFRQSAIQDYVAGLNCDYKILVFGKRFYGIKRYVRKDDFRASGSGMLEFDSAPDFVLDFAENIFSKLDAPYASLDIAVSEGGCHLIEYQILNFGPKGVVDSEGFFERYFDGWRFCKEHPDLEQVFFGALEFYIGKKYEISD